MVTRLVVVIISYCMQMSRHYVECRKLTSYAHQLMSIKKEKRERETVWLTKPKIFTIWLFTEKVC